MKKIMGMMMLRFSNPNFRTLVFVLMGIMYLLFGALVFSRIERSDDAQYKINKLKEELDNVT